MGSRCREFESPCSDQINSQRRKESKTMNKSNQTKAKFLGMSYGAACGQLRKRIMFSMAQELGRDTCYRCGKKIETVDELSVEHKKFWLHVNVDLFWDLDNIAFSHLKCNNSHQRIPHKITPPGGYSWCNICKRFRPKSEFPPKLRDKGGWIPCRECSTQERRKYPRKR